MIPEIEVGQYWESNGHGTVLVVKKLTEFSWQVRSLKQDAFYVVNEDGTSMSGVAGDLISLSVGNVGTLIEKVEKFNEEENRLRRANDVQVGGTHYKDQAIQPWDYIVANNIPFLEGNAIKYLTRWRDKGGIDDVRKAQHYIQKLLEVEEAKMQSTSGKDHK